VPKQVASVVGYEIHLPKIPQAALLQIQAFWVSVEILKLQGLMDTLMLVAVAAMSPQEASSG
jgi:hypothetical protein